MLYKIKILKDTPFDREGVSIDLKEFRNKYGYLLTEDTSDSELIKYLKDERRLQTEVPFNNQIGDWFDVIELPTNEFRMGDWVWHEQLKSAFVIMPYNPNDYKWRPNYVAFEAANKFVDIYKRKATQKEINDADLMSFLDGRLLVGSCKCYYYHNIYKEITGVQKLISSYIRKTNHMGSFNDLNIPSDDNLSNWNIGFIGLKFGCKEIPHNDIVKAAKFLRIIP